MAIRDLKEKTHKLYKRVGSLWCKALKENVVFNRHGWVHLSFERNGKRRYPKDLKLRHYLFNFVHEVVRYSQFYVVSRGSVNSRRGIKRKVCYFELVHFIKRERIYVSVILRKIESGKLHYYSVRRATNRIKKALRKGLV